MRAAINVASNYGRFLVGMASVAIVTPRAITALGIDRFGVWSLAAATCGFIALLELGIATTSMRFAAEAEGAGDTAARNARLATLLVAQLPLALAMALCGMLGAPFIARMLDLSAGAAPEFVDAVRIGSVAAALALPLSLWRAAIAGRGYQHVANLIDGGSIAAGAAVSLAGLAAGLGIVALAIGAATTVLLPGPLLYLVQRRHVPGLDLSWRRASREEWRRMRGFAAAAVSSNSANLAAQRMEPVIVNHFMPLAAVGQYSVAARIAEYATLLGRQLSSALTPFVARAHGAGDRSAIRETLVTGTRFQVALMLPCALLLAWHAPALLTAWLGPSALPAAVPLRLLCIAFGIAAVAMNPAVCLGMTGQHRLVARAALGGAALRLGTGACLLLPLGLAGTGVAAIVAALVVDIGVVTLRACRHIGVPVRDFARLAIAPSLPGLLAAAATAAALERHRAPTTLGEIFVQCLLAGIAFVVLFVPFGLREQLRLLRRRNRIQEATAS